MDRQRDFASRSFLKIERTTSSGKRSNKSSSEPTISWQLKSIFSEIKTPKWDWDKYVLIEWNNEVMGGRPYKERRKRDRRLRVEVGLEREKDS
jgi:hypothetical protein